MSETLCRHFGTCGGCAYQDLPEAAYLELKRNLVVDALARHGLAQIAVETPIRVASATRRRATLKVEKHEGRVAIGFHAARSHDIVDMQECRVLTPAIVRLLPPLREALAGVLKDGGKAELSLTDTDGGMDVSLDRPEARNARSTLAATASSLRIARLNIGGEIAAQFGTPFVAFDGIRVDVPPDVFLQPTREGEAALQGAVCDALGRAKSVLDLFAGCGTFSLPLARKARVHAVDSDPAALAALQAGARNAQGLKPVATEVRDLFRHPLAARELERFDLVVLDPPRAGARAQAEEIAKSKVKRAAYVSCNPETFARDARILVDAGLGTDRVRPVDQFLWSSHIELVAVFERH